MRQLEHALGLLAERGEPIPVDVLLGRLEAQLTAGGTAPDTVTASEQDMAVGPTARDGLSLRGRRSRWRGPLIAAGTAAAILVLVSVSMFFLGGDTGDVIVEPAPTTTMPAVQDDTTAVPAPIAAAWSFQGTVDDWLTEPVMLDGRYYATRKGLDEDTQQEVDGQVEGVIEDAGELWTSLDGVTWIPAEEGDRPPPASPEAPTDGAAVVVRRNPIGDQYGMLVAEGLWATSDGTSWREIALRPSQDNWIPWVETGGLGWIVYSPPREATVEADISSLFQGPRHGNLGLWYTPDTEAWFEVTDLGPLADTVGDTVDIDGEVLVVVNDGEVGVFGAAMIVRDTDILVYVNIARNSGWVIGNPHTDIWQLDLSEVASSATQETVPSTTNPAVADDGIASQDESADVEWNSILSTTKAKSAPTAAICPEGTNPDVAGPIDQIRPSNASVGYAAFDQRTGRVVYLDHVGATWTFDVCTNTWHQMHPTGWVPGELSGGLVYDVDSDVTVALGFESVSVYDANTNTWTRPASDGLGFDEDSSITPFGGAYDPVTGLIITSNRWRISPTSPLYWEFWAYDVDTNEWTLLGPLRLEPSSKDQLDFLGYSEQLDRLIVAGWLDGDIGTVLVDPWTGDATVLPIESPVVDIGWPNEAYGAAGGTVYATTRIMDTPHDICGFDANHKSWTACFDVPNSPEPDVFPFPALVGDPINNRLLLINGTASAWATASRVGAIDLATGGWTQLLAPTTP
jgi:hypothetical protein